MNQGGAIIISFIHALMWLCVTVIGRIIQAAVEFYRCELQPVV